MGHPHPGGRSHSRVVKVRQLPITELQTHQALDDRAAEGRMGLPHRAKRR